MKQRHLKVKFISLVCSNAILFSFLSITGCDQIIDTVSKEKITEGKIVYDLSYPMVEDDNIFSSIFPTEMTYKFKDNNSKNELKTKTAIFWTSFVANNSEKKVTHLVRVASKYSGVILNNSEIMEEYGKKPEGMQINPTDSTKEICGYVCNHAYVTFADNPSGNFHIFYTTEIGFSDSNWCTPFHEVKGVLLEATVNKFNIDMHMIAKSVVAEKHSANEFATIQDFEPITVKEMTDIFQSF